MFHALVFFYVFFAYGNKRNSLVFPQFSSICCSSAITKFILLRRCDSLDGIPDRNSSQAAPQNSYHEQRSESALKPRVSRLDRERRGENTQLRAALPTSRCRSWWNRL